KFTFTANWSSRKAYLLIGTNKKAGYPNSTSYWFRFKEIQLEKGNKATDYKLSQKDQEDKLDGAIDDFYNTEIKSNYSTTTQTKELLGNYVTSTEMQGNLDKIATYAGEYTVVGYNSYNLKEANGSDFDDAFSYEVTARSQAIDDSLGVYVLNSKGKGKGWELETLEEKGTTGKHPSLKLHNGLPVIGTKNSSTTDVVDVIYTKYAGSFTNLSKTNSMIEQKADEIELGVNRKLSQPSRNLIPHSVLPEENDNWSGFTSSTSITSAYDYMWIYDYTGNSGNSIAVQSEVLPKEIYTGQKYTLSFKAARLNNVDDRMIYCYLLNENGSNYFIPSSLITRTELGQDYRGLDLYYYTATFEPDFSGKARVLIGTRTTSTDRSLFYFKEPQLEYGSEATPYSPAPTDLVEASAQFKVTADEINSEVKKKVGNNESISKINQSSEKVSIDADKISLTAGSNLKLAVDNALRGGSAGVNLIGNTDFWINYDDFERTHTVSNTDETVRQSIILNTGFGKGWVTFWRVDGALSYLWTRKYSRNYFSVTKGRTYTFSVLAATNWDNELNYVYMRGENSPDITQT